jgi:hypothetical protein
MSLPTIRLAVTATTTIAVLACGGRAVDSGRESPFGTVDFEDPDAVILALRHQHSIELDRDLLQMARTALAQARGLVPELEGVHPIPYRVDHDLGLFAEDDRVAAAWGRGVVDTGIVEVDRLLQQYGAYRVDPVLVGSAGWFVVFFDRPLALNRLAPRLHQLAAVSVGPEGRGSSILPEEDIGWERLDGRQRLTFVAVESIWPQRACRRRTRWRVEVTGATAVLIERTADCVCLVSTETC